MTLLALDALLIACLVAMGSPDLPPQAGETAPAASAALAVEPPQVTDEKPRDYDGLHNVVAYHNGYLSGSVPEGDAGFDLLMAMGIKTIVSVDGAEPDVAKAKARGIRYIHLPIGYNGFDEKRKLELVRATRDAIGEGPVYIHCHHGKHRSAGAAGTVAASLGWLTPEQATARMKVSGTAPNYKGLYACTANATVLDPTLIDAVSDDFSEVSHPATFVKSMVEIDEINDRLELIEKAGWTAPKDHPDLVPVAEAGRMADLFRIVCRGDKVQSKPADFLSGLTLNGEQAQALEEMLAAGKTDVNELSAQLELIQTSCKECHAKHRD